MIQIEHIITKKNCFLKVSGHANFGEIGKDIVCAGVSSLYSALAKCVENADKEAFFDDTQGVIISKNEKCVPYFEMAICGMREIAKEYGEFVEVVNI